MRREGPRRVDPAADLGAALLEVEKPARYLGGEALSIRKTGDDLLSIALCFPDLYEIGMSNNAIRILYSGLNSMPSVRAERVFAPAPDFEALLARAGLPLYTLESGLALSDVDLLGLSLGYELAATSVLAVLEAGRIPLRASERGEGDPIVLAGGPAATNPHPLAIFLDAAFIGEAEEGFFGLAEELGVMKRGGASRKELLDRLSAADAVWMPGGEGRPAKRARRAIFGGFPGSPASTAFPLPAVKAVQDHGTVEIMRGCPNGCRFCHAGYFYRPQRVKPYEAIRSEVAALVNEGGYREITLASLSSGDYPRIGALLDALNAEWGGRMVSFQLPSLKISSFTLPIVRKLAEVRKSGLTFAVETPVDEWQRIINKDVSFEKTVAILEEARAAGFKQAKFYFMIGLPVPGRGLGEAKAIVAFFERLGSRIKLQINVNVGTFVPKPHTPFQWSAQLREEESLEAVNFLRNELRRFRNIKLSYHSPFVSQLEGVIARGDERVGELILAAYRRGARLDAWEERFDRELWRSVLADADWPVLEECSSERGADERLPWDDISIRVSKAALRSEYERSVRQEATSACMEECTDPCGVCGNEYSVDNGASLDEPPAAPAREGAPVEVESRKRPVSRMVFKYSKKGIASYLQHLSIVDAFERAFLIGGMDMAYSEGFNPMPRFETAQPLPIAVESDSEIASLLLLSGIDEKAFIERVNARLPNGLQVTEAESFPLIEGKKQRTIGSLEWGSEFHIRAKEDAGIPSLFRAVSDILDSRSVPGATLTRGADDASISLCLRLPKSRDHGLMRILEATTERRPVQGAFEILRSQIFADIGDGEPISFSRAYSTI
jgi:radical SAM-linked protein